MRGIGKSITESVFNSLNESNTIKPRLKESTFDTNDMSSRQLGTPVYTLDNIKKAIDDYNNEGRDIMVDFIEYDDDTNEIKLSAYALGGPEEGSDEGTEYTREFTIKPEGISYDVIYDALDTWARDHGTPDVFYEGVMVQTGSTTVTSDEVGVTIEDNGNTITTGNGVVVNIDNEDDVLPAENDLPLVPEETEEVEETEVEEVPEEAETIEEEVLEEPSEETEEEKNNSRIEEAVDGYYKPSSCIDIYQNPEFDYKITDITELDNVNSGDVRAIDMYSILNDLNESLALRYKTDNWGVLNPFVTRCGKDHKTNESYGSAILDIGIPMKENAPAINTVLTIELSGSGLLKECTIRDARYHKKIDRFCGKTANPVAHLESVIVDLINNREGITQYNEDVVIMSNEPRVKDKDIVSVDAPKDERIAKANKKFEKRKKEAEKRYKSSGKFKIEEPDKFKFMKEAVGLLDDEEAPLESEIPEDSLVDDALDESNTEVAIFHRKPESVKAIKAAEANGITTNKSNYKVVGTKELPAAEFEEFANHLSQPTEWLKEFSDINDESGMFTCVEVKNQDDETSYSILVDPQGYDYARYAAIKEAVLDEPEEELVEPEVEETEEEIEA